MWYNEGGMPAFQSDFRFTASEKKSYHLHKRLNQLQSHADFDLEWAWGVVLTAWV
ncbi:MAG: hypothetical protein LBQ66_08340 [Planctomycetaceae bacterium]|nr:hypothetical protein [Planctomycetaceae bacterium]